MANVKKHSETNKGQIGPVVAGIAGAAIGATAVALSDKKIRKKISRVFEDALDQGKEAFGDLQDKVQMQVRQIGKRVKNAIEEEKVRTKRKLNSFA